MDDVKKYWRDKVSGLFQWAVALYLLLVGWGLDKHDLFELRNVSWDNPAQRNKIFMALCLISFGVLYAVIFPLLIHLIYKKFLHSNVDQTVLPRRFAMACATGLSLLTLINSVLLAVL